MTLERFSKKARKDINESIDFFEALDDNSHEPRNIWKRLIRKLDILCGTDANLRQLEGQHLMAIIATQTPNACTILRMIDKYAYEATGWRAAL